MLAEAEHVALDFALQSGLQLWHFRVDFRKVERVGRDKVDIQFGFSFPDSPSLPLGHGRETMYKKRNSSSSNRLVKYSHTSGRTDSQATSHPQRPGHAHHRGHPRQTKGPANWAKIVQFVKISQVGSA